MKVGHGASVLAIRRGEELGGYLGRSEGIDGILDPLEVHALSFCDGTDRFVLVVVDVICVNKDLVAMIRKRLAPLGSTYTWVSATHTHSGPETGCVPGGTVTPPGVVDRLIQAAEEASDQAMRVETPAALRPFRAWASGVATRRNSAVDPDEALPIDGVTFAQPGGIDEGGHLGTLIVTPIHPTVFGVENIRASADLSGGIRRAAAKRIGGWAVSATGAAGDISTRATRRSRSLVEIDRLGEAVVDAVARALAVPSAMDANGATPLRASDVVTLLEPNTGLVRVVVEPETGDDPLAERRRFVLAQGLEIAASIQHDSRLPVPVTVEGITVEGINLIAIPGEPYLAIAEAIRARASRPTITLGYTNGYVGYLPEEGAAVSYETVVSRVAPASSVALVQAALTSIHTAPT